MYIITNISGKPLKIETEKKLVTLGVGSTVTLELSSYEELVKFPKLAKEGKIELNKFVGLCNKGIK